MPRFFVALLVLLAGFAKPLIAAPADGLPPRPVPFTFVTDQGNLLQAGEAKKLDSGLRRYAESTGTQVVVVTVPSLNGTDVAAYGRQLGTAWGVGQRGKNNGMVVVLAAKEHQVAIEAGSGLRGVITPELTSRVITQEMTPAFKQGNYFAGLRKGLSTLMLAANPSSNPAKNKPAAAATSSAAATGTTTGASLADEPASTGPADPVGVQQTEAAAPSAGLGMGALLVGAVVIIGGIWLLTRLFRRSSNASSGQAPDFMGNRPSGPTPNFGAPNAGYPQQPSYGNAPGATGGSGIGGMLATGAAAAAGAYLGNKLSSNHDEAGNGAHNFNSGSSGTGAAPAAGAADDYFSSRGGESAGASPEPDYFSDDSSSNNSGDYFSSDNSSYDNTSSDDTGGGGFDGDGGKGSW